MIKLTRNAIIIIAGSLLIITAAVLYVVLGVTVMQSYVGEASYKRTKCTVRATEIYRMNTKDDWYKCPWKCTIVHTPDGLKTQCEISEFPCLRVVVDVRTKNGLKSAIIHNNPETMTKYSDCSTYYCDQDSVVNEKEVNKFRKRYGVVGSEYDCYYNLNSLQSDDYDDDGQEHALLRLTYSTASYVNSIVWPTVAIVAGILCLLYGCFMVYKENSRKKLQLKKRLMTNL